jgi:hypothetical protein
MLITLFKNFFGKVIVLVGVFLSGAVFVRFTYETAVEAKALSLKNRDEIISLQSDLADKVADRMIIINNDHMNKVDAKFDKINEKLNRIDRKIGE